MEDMTLCKTLSSVGQEKSESIIDYSIPLSARAGPSLTVCFHIEPLESDCMTSADIATGWYNLVI